MEHKWKTFFATMILALRNWLILIEKQANNLCACYELLQATNPFPELNNFEMEFYSGMNQNAPESVL